ncbi:MAG TPA: SRPBCC family protein [Actinomycetota bacterium]|nr:SRPBCC family protein [Actinomycetota bacterium]
MLIENQFEVPESIERAWAYLLDVEKVAPCAPGAELTEVVDDHTWKGRIVMKLGPVGLSFAGTVSMEERDDANHRVVLKAQGMEQKGKGAASATVTSWLEEQGPATLVKMQADITLTGTVAQLSRGLLPDVSAKLTQQFAECLRASMIAEGQEAGAATAAAPGAAAPGAAATAEGAAATGTAAAAAPPRPAQPKAQAIGGIRLGLWALLRAIGRFVRRIFGGGRAT